MAREATPRRSARLCRDSSTSVNNGEAASPLIPAAKLQLASITEREATPRSAQKSAGHVVATPSTGSKLKEQIQSPTSVQTPKTEPRPSRDQLQPELVHRSTKKPSCPTSGEKLGFVDISREPRGSAPENTPSHPSKKIDPSFQFQFSQESNLSSEGRKIMESIREDANRIKAQMKAEKELQDRKDAEADAMFVSIAGRRIAKPSGKAGRFSDVHMAQFKKMDSIANHASAFRANPSYVRPTAQSLKRTSSKADLDSPERPKTAGKSPSMRIPPPVTGRPMSTSPFKSIRCVDNEDDAAASAKRVRRNDDADVAAAKPSVIPRPTSSRLLSPTKSSLARTSTGTAASSTPRKPFFSSRQKSVVKSLKSIRDTKTSFSPVKSGISTPVATSLPPQTDKPLPATPGAWPSSAATARSKMIEEADHAIPANVEHGKPPATTSKLPTFAGLKSILRKKGKTTPSRPIDIKRPNTVGPLIGTPKKVDFTPSVKSRYAVKLAAASPSPAKHEMIPIDKFEPVLSGDASAIQIGGTGYDWDDESDDNVYYPEIPPSPVKPGPVIHTFSQKARDLDRRESREFKSAFASLDAVVSPQLSLTSINTEVNKTGPLAKLDQVSTQKTFKGTIPVFSGSPKKSIPSWSGTTEFSDARLPFSFQNHGLPDKKRRRESAEAVQFSGESDKENSNYELHNPESAKSQSNTSRKLVAGEDDIEGDRFAKRRRTALPTFDKQVSFGQLQDQEEQKGGNNKQASKPNAAREQAKKHAMARKSRGLSLNRLNALASPKKRV